jgi:protein-disulfide isomerase
MANNSDSSRITVYFIIGFLILITVGVVIAGIVSNNASSPAANASSTMTTAAPISSADWTEGSSTAPVTLIEYGDYECPACGAYYPLVKQIQSDFGNKLLFVFRNFPLYTIHPDAGIAAQAAEAAGLQGKFWQMHDLLYQNQATWSTADPSVVTTEWFNGYASSLGLNVTQFDTDMNSTQVTNKIAADVASGNAAQINHTPTFFIDQKQIVNPGSLQEFENDIDASLGVAPTVTPGAPVTSGTAGVPTVITTTSTPE